MEVLSPRDAWFLLHATYHHDFNTLAAAFPDYDFSVSGAYCHQKSIVDINMSAKPEPGIVVNQIEHLFHMGISENKTLNTCSFLIVLFGRLLCNMQDKQMYDIRVQLRY